MTLEDTLTRFAAEMAQYRKGVQSAHEARTCTACGQSIDGRIYSPAGRAEYQISGVCEICFDDMFEERDE